MAEHPPHGDHHLAGHGGLGLIPVEEARERVLSRIEALPPVELPLRDAFGCVLAADVRAEMNVPAFPSSAMDGYAVRSEDVASATRDEPVALEVVGRAAAGRMPTMGVEPGTAVEIATGAPVPPGADAVVPIEDCGFSESATGGARLGQRVLVFRAPAPRRHVRPEGQDVRPGDVIVESGRRVGAPELGFLASAGIGSVEVHPRPRVIVLSTGDELVEPGVPAAYGQVYDANAYTLLGAIEETRAIVAAVGRVPDDPDRLRQAVEANVDRADAFITSGGVSVGERDPVKGAFRDSGDVEFTRVAMQPGMPQAFGIVKGRPLFGLPGNPVSVFVSFEVFVRPALLKMMGRADLFRPEAFARLEGDIEGIPNKTRFARVRVRRGPEGWVAEATGGHQSNLLATVARANALAIVPPGPGIRAGENCRVMVFRSDLVG